MTGELKRTAYIAQCGACALSSRRRRASLQELFALSTCSHLSWEVLRLPGGAAPASTDKSGVSSAALIFKQMPLVVFYNLSFCSVIRVLNTGA